VHFRVDTTDRATKIYAKAIAQYGAEEGHRIGAVDDLRQLATHGPNTQTAQQILTTYWNETAITTGNQSNHVE